jgi:hypothetical protein
VHTVGDSTAYRGETADCNAGSLGRDRPPRRVPCASVNTTVGPTNLAEWVALSSYQQAGTIHLTTSKRVRTRRGAEHSAHCAVHTAVHTWSTAVLATCSVVTTSLVDRKSAIIVYFTSYHYEQVRYPLSLCRMCHLQWRTGVHSHELWLLGQ